MNPMMVAQNRTARLVREAQTPVYSTSTKVAEREHLSVIEIEYGGGGRAWSAPMPDSEVDGYLSRNLRFGDAISDIDHAAKCWCFND